MKTIVMLLVCLGLLVAPTVLLSLNHPGVGLVGFGMMCGVLLTLPVILVLWLLYQRALWLNQSRGEWNVTPVKRLPQ